MYNFDTCSAGPFLLDLADGQFPSGTLQEQLCDQSELIVSGQFTW